MSSTQDADVDIGQLYLIPDDYEVEESFEEAQDWEDFIIYIDDTVVITYDNLLDDLEEGGEDEEECDPSEQPSEPFGVNLQYLSSVAEADYETEAFLQTDDEK